MARNGNLQKAKAEKNDEFYTRIEDIEKELSHYTQHFSDKVVYCNCDNPEWSAFWKYFHLNFSALGVKRLISTHYEKEKPTYKMIYDGGNDEDITAGEKTQLKGDGDFRSGECLDILDESDIVVSNPPFSLFSCFVSVLMEHRKQFLIIGSKNAITYKSFFPLLKDNLVWLGCSNVHEFIQPDGSIKKFGNIGWYTNMDVAKRHKKLVLQKKYNEKDYQKYDNYDALNVDKISNIPCDYFPCWFTCEKASECQYAKTEGRDQSNALCEHMCNGEMGVPISYMEKHTPGQFDIVGADYDVANPIRLNGGRKKGTGRFYITEQGLKKNSAGKETIQQNCYSQKSTDRVMALSEFQSHSLKNITRNNSGLSELQTVQDGSENSNASPSLAEQKSTTGYLSGQRCNGVMGVPISFLDKYNPDQFVVIGVINHGSDGEWDLCKCMINGKQLFKRIAIRRSRPENT